MLFSYALLCFLLASTASAEGPANLGRRHNPDPPAIANGTKPGPGPPAYNPEDLETVEELELKEGHVYSVRRRVAVSHHYDSMQFQTFDCIVAGFILQAR